MDWLIKEKFISHSGQELNWKVECDALTDNEIDVFAYLIGRKFQGCDIQKIVSIPRGGDRLALALHKYIPLKVESKTILIVDDVFTTGKSMEEAIGRLWTNNETCVRGAVMFARSKPFSWVYSVFNFIDF